MATHTNHKLKNAIYMVTFTCFKWLPLFSKSNIYDNIYNWFHHINKRGKVLGYLIMPNHLYVLIYLQKKAKILTF